VNVDTDAGRELRSWNGTQQRLELEVKTGMNGKIQQPAGIVLLNKKEGSRGMPRPETEQKPYVI
jgi:hypothetical protein